MVSSSSASRVIKIEDSPEPGYIHTPTEASAPLATTATTPSATPSIVDPQDPDGFLRRCSGHNKKTKVRCSAAIGKNAKHTHSTFLPTCHAHKDQQSFAGWCQFMQMNGERCGRLFRWTPPYFELCEEHQGHPDTPCHFMALPLELRQEILRYLLPTQPIGSSSSPLHQDVPFPQLPDHTQPMGHIVRRAGSRSIFQASPPAENNLLPFPIMDLFLVSRRMHDEVKDLLYSSIPFTIDIRKDGTFMCGRRLLEPRRPDGSAHFTIDDAEKVARKFTTTFDFAAVKNYNVDILVENCTDDGRVGYHINQSWDEEVEMYDIRDYCGVVVSGILSKAQNLCKLNIRLGLSKFNWKENELLTNVKCLLGPFERLRNVRRPRLRGVYDGFTQTNFMVNVPLRSHQSTPVNLSLSAPLCSVPRLPTQVSLIPPGDPNFDAYKRSWEKLLSKVSDSPPVKPPIRAMFTEFKQFYTKLSTNVPAVMHRHGKHAFLHRARVARENENVEAFRNLRNELINYWYLYLEQEEQRKKDMETHMCRMLDSDVYPSSEIETIPRRASTSSDTGRILVRADLGHEARKNEKRKRPSQDAKPVPLRHNDLAKAGNSGATSPQQLQHNHSMALNPQREGEIPQARAARLYAAAQAHAQVADAWAAHPHNQAALNRTWGRRSTDPPSFSDTETQESAVQTQSSSSAISPTNQVVDLFLNDTVNNAANNMWVTPFGTRPGLLQAQLQQQRHQQMLQQQQRQLQQAQQINQCQAQLQQRCHYDQAHHSVATGTHMTPQESHQILKEVTRDGIQMESDSSATVSPMTAHAAIPSRGPGFVIQSNRISGNSACANIPCSHASGTDYDGTDRYQMPAPDTAPSWKKRRIDSGISVGVDAPTGYETASEPAIIMNHVPVEQGGAANYHYSPQSSALYAGKGKGRAANEEEPTNVMWVD